MFFHEYPYSNMHELNLDWIIAEVKKIPALEKEINDKIDSYIADNISKFFSDVIYDADTESIILLIKKGD